MNEREKWGNVPWNLAHHCQNCDLVNAAPNGRCAQCGSEAVDPLKREEPEETATPETNTSWLCFHCGFVTTDEAEAEAHFGDRDDAEEFKPLCRWWARMSTEERAGQFQDLIQELNGSRREAGALRVSNEGLAYQVNAQEDAIRSYKPFRECRSINDVFFVYDSMEGRALAAEERLKEAEVRPAPQPLFLECPFCKAKFAFHTQEQVDIMIRLHLDEHAARLSEVGETMPDGYRAAAQKGESHV